MWLADSKLSILWQVCQICPCLVCLRGQCCTTGASSAPCCEKCFTFLYSLNPDVLILAFLLSCCLWHYKKFLGQHITQDPCIGKPWSAPVLQDGAEDLCCSFKGPGSGQSCASITAQSLEQRRNTSGSSCTCCCSLEEAHESHLWVVYPKVQSSAPWYGRALLPAAVWAGAQDPPGLPVPLWLAEISLPFNWHPISPPGCGWLPHPLGAAMQNTSFCSPTLPGTRHAGLLTQTMSLWGSCQQCCPQDCFSKHAYRFNLLKICHKEK